MNRFVHMLNCGLWLINAATWIMWSHRPGMAAICFGMSCVAAFMWWTEMP